MSRPPIDERTTMSRTTVNGMGGLIDFADGGGVGGFFANGQPPTGPGPAVMTTMTTPSPSAMASMNGYTYQPNFTNVGMSTATDPSGMMLASAQQQQQHLHNMMMMQAQANAQAAHVAMNPFHMSHPFPTTATAMAPAVAAASVPSVIAGPPSELYMNGKVYKAAGPTSLTTGLPASAMGCGGVGVPEQSVPQQQVASSIPPPFTPMVPAMTSSVSSAVMDDQSLNERVAKKVNEVLQKSKGLYPGLGGSMASQSNRRCDDEIDFTQELKRLNKKMAEKVSSFNNNDSNNSGKRGKNRY